MSTPSPASTPRGLSFPALRILLEGPAWAGQWTEIVADTFAELGCQVDVVYHNRKRGMVRLVALVNKLLPLSRRWLAWQDLQRRRVHDALAAAAPYDLFFSIQGKVTAADVAQIKARHPGLRVVYWHGDVLLPVARAKFDELKPASISGGIDRFLVSYRGLSERLTAEGFRNVTYFPFGVSQRYHAPPQLTAADHARYDCAVAFVGTAYPERVELIRYLNAHLPEPVRVWGRSWGGTGVNSGGGLSMPESLKVAAAAKLSLNIHHPASDNGFNMKFYEIPAAGGMEICDWQPELERNPLGPAIPAFKNREELLALVRTFLADEPSRQQASAAQHRIACTDCLYRDSLSALLSGLGFPHEGS